ASACANSTCSIRPSSPRRCAWNRSPRSTEANLNCRSVRSFIRACEFLTVGLIGTGEHLAGPATVDRGRSARARPRESADLTMRNGELSPNFREQAIETLKKTSADDPLDVFIVGGGVTGAGSAFDAATRGLKVGVVDAKDWASGTSSRSSK